MVAVDIANLALGYLGDTATVSSLDPPDGSAQAQHCARFYPMALNLLLEAHKWNFTTTRTDLALVATDYFGWRFVYAAPSDATDIFSVLPKCMYPQGYFAAALRNWYGYSWLSPLEFESNSRRDYHIEVRNGQQVILTNAEDAVVRYAMSTVTPGMFPALFTDALAWKLASMLAGPLLKGDVGAAESKRCLQMYGLFVSQATEQDSNQQHDAPDPIPSSIAARF